MLSFHVWLDIGRLRWKTGHPEGFTNVILGWIGEQENNWYTVQWRPKVLATSLLIWFSIKLYFGLLCSYALHNQPTRNDIKQNKDLPCFMIKCSFCSFASKILSEAHVPIFVNWFKNTVHRSMELFCHSTGLTLYYLRNSKSIRF